MEQFRQRGRKLRATQTSADARLWQMLRGRRLARWKFRRQHPNDRYVVDFAAVEVKLIVDVDGVTHNSPSEIARDAERTKLLEAFGFHVVRVSNVDVYDNLNGVLATIDQARRPN
jgi:very-short-patch-repair endonuclease